MMTGHAQNGVLIKQAGKALATLQQSENFAEQQHCQSRGFHERTNGMHFLPLVVLTRMMGYPCQQRGINLTFILQQIFILCHGDLFLQRGVSVGTGVVAKQQNFDSVALWLCLRGFCATSAGA